jgi:hypothetical protein
MVKLIKLSMSLILISQCCKFKKILKLTEHWIILYKIKIYNLETKIGINMMKHKYLIKQNKIIRNRECKAENQIK